MVRTGLVVAVSQVEGDEMLVAADPDDPYGVRRRRGDRRIRRTIGRLCSVGAADPVVIAIGGDRTRFRLRPR